MSNPKSARVVLALVAVLCAATAVQATVIYQENFDSYANGTALTAVPGWYNWNGITVPTIVGGKAVIGGGADMLLNMTDIFSYGNTQATIEYDTLSYLQGDYFFSSGDASGLDFNYSEYLGYEHGSDLLYHANQGGFDYGSQVSAPSPLGPNHWVINLTKLGSDITWNATFDGNPLLLQGDHTTTITDPRGLNTMEWYLLGGVGTTLDNFVITAVPEPATMSLLVLGGMATLIRRRNRRA